MIGNSISHYRILEKLGEGGMGIVYKAEDTRLKRPVAIKFLPRHISSNNEERKRFEIEAQAAAALNHPNISIIHSIEEFNNEVYIVMEYIDGSELKKKIESGPMSVEESLNIIEQIAKGLQAAHQKGITHRDIKSSNIMLNLSGQIKIMDFGLAKFKDSVQMTKVGTTVGTIAYMSPEQARGETVDHRSDIWAVGIIFYEMLAGKLPYRGDFEHAIMYSIINEEAEPITSIREDVPIGIDQMLKKMLSKDLNFRYQNLDEFLKDLNNFRVNKFSPRQASDEKTIAVLPFENISPDKETDYFADGLAEELIINLSKLKEMNVVARTNSMRYKGTEKNINTIGRELGVRYIMEGSVRKFKDDLRISVQMIDVSKGTQLWGETYKGKLADIFDIQEKVSKEIVDALMVTLSPVEKIGLTKRPTVNAEAFDLCLRARDYLYRFNKSNLKIAIQLFQRAIELDTRYAAAYAGLGESYATLYQLFERNETWLEKSIESCLKAIMYDSSLSEAYSALSLSYFNKQSLDEALDASKKAIDLDPNNFNAYWILARIYHLTDRDVEAISLLEKVILINPDFYSAYGDLRMIYEQIGETEKHKSALQQAINAFPRYLASHPDDARAHMLFAMVLSESERKDEAKKEASVALELNPSDPLMFYNAACFYALMGEKKLAIEALKNSVAAGHEDYEWFKRDPDLNSIREEPEYIELMNGK
jgi:serine/threonine protein kinase/tetratricopeptide (TPR) repeat protein